MSSISSIDTSIYSGIIEDLSSYTPSRTALDSKTPAVSIAETIALSKSAEDLDNAMVSAIENGYSVNDAVNIKLAQHAYAANCKVFNMIADMQTSTFELTV